MAEYVATWLLIFGLLTAGWVAGRAERPARRKAIEQAAWRDGWDAKDEQLRALARVVPPAPCPFWACDLDHGHDGDHLLDLAGRDDLPWPLG